MGGPVRSLIGADIALYDVLPAPHSARVRSELSGASHAWHAWGEVLDPAEGTRILARHEDQFYAGRPAAISRKLGAGTITYVGIETASGDLEQEIVRRVFVEAGVAVEDYPPQLMVDWRDGFWIASNFASIEHDAPVPPGASLVVGTRRLPPGGVAIWKE